MTSPATVLTREGAQRAAERELSKPGYQQAQPPWWARPVRWLLDQIGHLWDSLASATGGSAALAVILAGLVALLALAVWRLGPGARRRRTHGAPFETLTELTATDHRRAAEAFAAKGRWAEAVRERLRAIARDLEQRALVDRRPGRTAFELATDGGRALPACAALLREAADLFAGIWYGSAVPTAEDYRRLVEIDRGVQQARPERTAEPAGTLVAP